MDTEAFTANLIELPSVPILKTGTSAEVWDLVPLDKNSKPVQTKILPKIFIAIPPPDGCSPVPENRHLAIDRIVIGEAKNYTCLKRQVFPSVRELTLKWRTRVEKDLRQFPCSKNPLQFPESDERDEHDEQQKRQSKNRIQGAAADIGNALLIDGDRGRWRLLPEF